jgi:hypothetical protein
MVQAEDYESAREAVFAEIGQAFSFMYDEQEFAGQVERYGLHEVDLQPMAVIE